MCTSVKNIRTRDGYSERIGRKYDTNGVHVKIEGYCHGYSLLPERAIEREKKEKTEQHITQIKIRVEMTTQNVWA
jgi:hypothetical protein